MIFSGHHQYINQITASLVDRLNGACESADQTIIVINRTFPAHPLGTGHPRKVYRWVIYAQADPFISSGRLRMFAVRS